MRPARRARRRRHAGRSRRGSSAEQNARRCEGPSWSPSIAVAGGPPYPRLAVDGLATTPMPTRSALPGYQALTSAFLLDHCHGMGEVRTARVLAIAATLFLLVAAPPAGGGGGGGRGGHRTRTP